LTWETPIKGIALKVVVMYTGASVSPLTTSVRSK